MSPRRGQPMKESPRVCKVLVNFSIDEKERLDNYCESHDIKLATLCRNEVLKLVKKDTQTEQDEELKQLRKQAKKHSLIIAKGYRIYADTEKKVLDDSGEKITGYLITDKRNNIIEGATDNQLYTMNFNDLVEYFANYSGR